MVETNPTGILIIKKLYLIKTEKMRDNFICCKYFDCDKIEPNENTAHKCPMKIASTCQDFATHIDRIINSNLYGHPTGSQIVLELLLND